VPGYLGLQTRAISRHVSLNYMNLHCTALFSAINSFQKVYLQCLMQYQDEGVTQLTFTIGAFTPPEDPQQLSHDIEANLRLPTSGFWNLAALGIGTGRPVVPDQCHHILHRTLQQAVDQKVSCRRDLESHKRRVGIRCRRSWLQPIQTSVPTRG
jgi:hypothetical protein